MRYISSRANRAYLIAACAFLLGCLYYLLCRNPLISALEWLIPRMVRPMIFNIRATTIPACSYMPAGIQDGIPDGLWSFAYATMMTRLWLGHSGWMSTLWLGTIPVVCIGYEAFQMAGIIPGTFSGMDLFFSVSGMTIGVLLVSSHRQ